MIYGPTREAGCRPGSILSFFLSLFTLLSSSFLFPLPLFWDWCLLLSQGATTPVPLHALHVNGHAPLLADRWHDRSAMGRQLALGPLPSVPRRCTVLAPCCWLTTWHPTGPTGVSRNGLPPMRPPGWCFSRVEPVWPDTYSPCEWDRNLVTLVLEG